MSAPEPDEEHDDLRISDHAPSLPWLEQTSLEPSVLVTRYSDETGYRDFKVTVEEVTN